jgi:hypothetical protein
VVRPVKEDGFLHVLTILKTLKHLAAISPIARAEAAVVQAACSGIPFDARSDTDRKLAGIDPRKTES